MSSALAKEMRHLVGQRVCMLVETMGCDAQDVEWVFPVGATGIIDDVDHYGVTVVIESTIVNVLDFDELDLMSFLAEECVDT